MKKSAKRDANTARALAVDYEIRSRDPGHANLGVVFVVPTQGCSVLYVCAKFEGDCSFRSKVIRGSQISPRRRPLPGGAGPPKFNQLDMVTTCT